MEDYEESQEYVEKGIWGKIKETIGKVPFVPDAIAMYYCALDSKTPIPARAIAFSALAYFILPIDAIPDIIAIAGYTDDAGAIAAALMVLTPYITDEHRRKAEDFLVDRN